MMKPMKSFFLCFLASIITSGCQMRNRAEKNDKVNKNIEAQIRQIFKNNEGVYSEKAMELFYHEKELSPIVKRISMEGGSVGEKAKYFISKFYPDESETELRYPWELTIDNNLINGANRALKPLEKILPKSLKGKKSMSVFKNEGGRKALVIVKYKAGALASMSYAMFFIKKGEEWTLIYGTKSDES